MVNHVGGHGRPVAPDLNQNAMQLQRRGAQAANATAGVDGAGEGRRQEIDRIAHLLENHFPGGAEIRNHLHQKATVLYDEIGHDVDDVKATLAKAEKLDQITSLLEGGANALGYALSGVPGDLIGKGIAQHLGLQPGTPMHDFATGMAGGVTAVGMKAVLEKVLDTSLKDTKWLQADAEKLEPFMQEVMKKRDGALHKIGQAGMGGLGFDARNVITGGLAAGTQTLQENDPRNPPVGILAGAAKPGYIANQSVGTVLTVAAGSMSAVVQNKYNKLHGPEFLFGRSDWKERYSALTDTSVSGQLVNGAKNRVATVAKDAATLQKWGAGFANLLTINQLAEMVALGAGLGGTNIAKSAARDGVMKAAIGNMPISPQDLLTNPAFRALREGAAQAANLPTAALAYFGQGLAGVGSSAAKNLMKNAAMNVYSNVRQAHATNTGAANADSDSHSSAITGQDVPLPASRASSTVTGQDVPLPASRASSTVTGQDVPLPSSRASSIATGQDVPLPSSRASSIATGQDVPLPSSRASSIATGQDVPLPSSRASSIATGQDVPLPSSRASSIATGQDVPLPSSRASSIATGQDVPLPSSGDSSTAATPHSAESRSPTPTGSQNEMLAQQLAERIGKMASPSDKTV